MKALAALIALCFGVCAPATAAWAPSPFATAVASQRLLGLSPCTPAIGPLPEDALEGLAADADNGEQSGQCAIRVSATLEDKDLEWVAWHEVCHLSTLGAIMRDDERPTEDPAHTHPLFTRCLDHGPRYRGGY